MTLRRRSPLDGARPTRADLARFATNEPNPLDDVLPAIDPETGESKRLRLLIVGINPGLWTAAVNAPFARPGNRFWPALYVADLTDHLIDASRGLSEADEQHLAERGIGITNLIGRATARADELSRDELRDAGEHLTHRVQELRPERVAIAGITAFRVAYGLPKANLGRQDAFLIEAWPSDVSLWVVPQPSGLNAHESVQSLAEKWREVWQSPAP